MFMLCAIEDHVRIEPAHLGLSTASAIEQELKRLYLDKVVPDVGLVVSIRNVDSFRGGDVHVGDGGVHFKATFRLVVFRPYEGEVLLGQAHAATKEGLSLSLGFTQDVLVPEQYMQTPGSRFDEASQRWVWEYEGEDMPLELGATVRFKVREVLFQQPDATAAGKDGAAIFQPMKIIADIDGDGLGCVHWWDGDNDEADAAE